MCTVSIIPLAGGGFRLVSSRDELRARPPAKGPARVPLPRGGHAIWPRDPKGGGTWVAAGEHGVALTILNRNLEPAPDLVGVELASRGRIIPALIDSSDGAEAVGRLRAGTLEAFAPFRLIAVDAFDAGRPRVLEASWDRAGLDVVEHGSGPVCFVSSGLGDSRVAPRVPLFEAMVRGDPSPEAQDAYHAHFWPDRLPISVWMARREARTVSVTRVRVAPGEDGGRPEVELRYEPVTEPEPAGIGR